MSNVKDGIKKVCYVLGASRDRSPRATKIANVINAKIIDCPSKARRYTTFPILLISKLIKSHYDIVIVNNIPSHIIFPIWIASKLGRFILILDFVNAWRYAIRKKSRYLSGFASCFENWFYRRIKYGLAINPVAAEYAKNSGITRVVVVYDAADHDIFKPSSNIDPVIIIAANLRKDEGVDLLLKALKLVKNKIHGIRCIIVGRGEEESSLKELANNLELGYNVEFLGWIPYSQMPKIYSRASVGINAIRSVSPLAFPIKLFEYMSCGLAVISTDTPTIRTILEHGKNALLFKPGEYADLASHIINLLYDRDLMMNLRKTARETAETEINWKFESRKLRKFVESVLSLKDL